MSVQRRHGLRTLVISAGASRVRVEQLVSGRRTAVVRPDIDGEPVEQPGERLLVTDDRGRAAAVVEVRDVVVGTLATVPDDVPPADDPDTRSRASWTAARCREWGASRPADVLVVGLRVRVIGLDCPFPPSDPTVSS